MSYLRGGDPAGEGSVRRRRLSQRECRSWLGSHHEGRLGYVTGRGPRAVVVCYSVTNEQIVLQLPDYSEITQYSLDSQVTLEVDGQVSPRGGSEVVMVTGRAHRPEDPEIVSATEFTESWPPGVSTNIMCVDLTTVEGTETTPI